MIATKYYVDGQTIPLRYEIDKIKEELHKDRNIGNYGSGPIIDKCFETRIHDLEETLKALLRHLEVRATDTPAIPSGRTIEPYCRDKK